MRRTVVPLIVGFLVLAAACSDGSSTADSPTTVITSPGTETLPTSTTTTPVVAATTASTTTTIAVTGPVYGGRVVVGIDEYDAPSSLNPYVSHLRQISQAIHAGVYDIDASTQELIPDLVTELPTVGNGGVVVNEDGTMTVRYAIREEAVWADGVPVSGDDFAFTVTVLLDHADDVWGAALDLVDGDSMAAGRKTFEVTLTEPTLGFEMMLSTIVPRHQVEGTDFLADWNDVPWVSAGPFVFDSWDRDAGILTLVRNDRYWKIGAEGDQLPYLDQLEFHTIEEMEGIEHHQRYLFLNEEIDVMQPYPVDDEIESLEAAGATIDSGLGSPLWEHFNFNFGVNNRNPDSLNRHLLFRQAVAHAIDRKWLVDEWYGQYSRALDSLWEVFTPSVSTDGWAQYDYDPDRSRELLAELCADLDRDCDADPPATVFSVTGSIMRPWQADRFE
ncbi:MAG: hypothetical protein KJO84_05430, partial [Acidimicrobiia bacterium]|nr:hypothetical protein [Acidimicrobiia bacterium]